MEKYFKNFILNGEIDYYCVLCKETFGDETDVERHMRWEKHRKVLKLQEYLHKFKKDFIYKNDDVYYCEVCNLITTDVASHVKENNHLARKATTERISKKSEFVKREPNGTIKVHNKIVSKLQWHGIKDGKCSLCNLDNINKFNHISSASHMSNLTQSCIKCEGDQCYRELKSNKFYCFTCFDTYENEQFTNHWTTYHSKIGTKKGSEDYHKSIKNFEYYWNDDNISIKILAKLYSSSYEVDVLKKTANCLLCDVVVTPSVKALDEHKSVFHPGVETFTIHDHGKRRHELAVYARENYIKLNEGGSKISCTLCDIFTSAHINCAKQHVGGMMHQGHLELKGLIKNKKHEKPPVQPVSWKSFSKETYGPFNIAEYNVLVFNDGICIDVLSFGLINIIDGFRGRKGKCYACDLTMNYIELMKHSTEIEHRNIMMNCKVLFIDENGHQDFIREIHPGLYHCGCCNKVFPFWDNMAKHLRSFTHKVQRKKKEIVSSICAKLYLNPFLDLDDIEEYDKLRSLDGFN